MSTARYIDTPAKLDALLQDLDGASWVAIDTEFQREKTFYAKLCLIQLATPEHIAIVDPLALQNLDPLLDWLYREDLMKVFHAARQDQELFFDRTGKPLPNVFDSQLAAPLLGHPEQAGYGRLVQDLLGVTLKKSHSRTDWTRRPLSDAQLDYAADDVIYLARLFPILWQQLEDKKRLKWLQRDFDKLSDTELYTSPPEQAWKRIRYAKQMKGSALSIVQVLAAWREEQAQRKNIPRGWLLKDEVIIDLAKQKPADAEALSHIRGLQGNSRKNTSNTLLSLIQDGLKREPQPAPEHHRPSPTRPEHEALADYLMAFIRLRCQEAEMNPATLTSRQELLRLVKGETDLPILSSWRATVVGDELLSVLSGTTTLTVSGRELRISE